jgi:hypothetical protein
MNTKLKTIAAGLLVAGLAGTGFAGTFTEFTTQSSYLFAVGPQQVITFQGLPGGTVLGAQFSGQGVTFNDGNDSVDVSGNFVTDGVGADASGSFDLRFSSPISSIGVDYPGAVIFDYYLGATALGSSSQFGGSGTGFFGGALENGGTFDRVVIRDWVDNFAFIDNLYFGGGPAAVPDTGSALGLLSLAGTVLAGLRRLQSR